MSVHRLIGCALLAVLAASVGCGPSSVRSAQTSRYPDVTVTSLALESGEIETQVTHAGKTVSYVWTPGDARWHWTTEGGQPMALDIARPATLAGINDLFNQIWRRPGRVGSVQQGLEAVDASGDGYCNCPNFYAHLLNPSVCSPACG